MLAVNTNKLNVQIMNAASPELKKTNRSTSQSNSKSPSKRLRPPVEKETVDAESPVQRNKHSNTMRQVHVNIKPKAVKLKPVNAIFHEKQQDQNLNFIKPTADENKKNSARYSTASSGAASAENNFISTDAEITKGWDLKGNNRVNELLQFSQEVSEKIDHTIMKIDNLGSRAKLMANSKIRK